MTSSTSGSPRRRFFGYLAVAAGCAVFSAVYESFSHGVVSVFMVGLCLVPLLAGALPELVLWCFSRLDAGGPWRPLALACAVATLSTGSALQGVLEIYGTTNRWVAGYWWVGCALAAVSVLLWLAGMWRSRGASA